MLTIDQLKQKWGENQATSPIPGKLDNDSFHKIVKSRVKKHTNIAMQYFWASFTLQIIVYALLSHVILRYWGDSEIVYMAAAGILLFIPFTVILMIDISPSTRYSIDDIRYAAVTFVNQLRPVGQFNSGGNHVRNILCIARRSGR